MLGSILIERVGDASFDDPSLSGGIDDRLTDERRPLLSSVIVMHGSPKLRSI